MNPPYDGNLHLKILRTVIEQCKGAEIVCLHPNPYKIYRYAMDSQRVYLNMFYNKDVDVTELSHRESNDMFGLAHQISELCINHIKPNGNFDPCKKIFKNDVEKSIWDKIIAKRDSLLGCENKYTKRHGEQKGYFVNFYVWHGTPEMNARERLLDFTDREHTRTVYFENEIQRENFIKSFDTKFINYYVKGVTNENGQTSCFMFEREVYNDPVTDAFLYKYFALTDEEIKEIESALSSKSLVNIINR
jgi:hypothetical protein